MDILILCGLYMQRYKEFNLNLNQHQNRWKPVLTGYGHRRPRRCVNGFTIVQVAESQLHSTFKTVHMLVVISMRQLRTPLKNSCFLFYFTCSSSCIEAAKGSPSARRAIIVNSTISPQCLGFCSSLQTAVGKLCVCMTGCKVTTQQG